MTRIPSRWRTGDRVLLLRGDTVLLIRWLWQNAARLSLAHDVSDGGLELALREASDWSGVAFSAPRAEGAGVVVATSEQLDWPDAVELGVV